MFTNSRALKFHGGAFDVTAVSRLMLRMMVPIAVSCLVAGCAKPVDKVVSLCETELKDRLLSPATYKRADVQTFVEPVPVEQYIHDNRGLMPIQITALRNGTSKPPTKYTALIAYDSANEFGTMIRDRASCELVSSGEITDTDSSFVRVNGETRTDRLVDSARAIVRGGVPPTR